MKETNFPLLKKVILWFHLLMIALGNMYMQATFCFVLRQSHYFIQVDLKLMILL
jgi:hypothetical protein